MKMRELVGADFSISPRTWCRAGDVPTMSALLVADRSLSSATSLRRRVASMARCVMCSSRSILKGFSI